MAIRFKDLKIGQHFTFDNGVSTFSSRCKKISSKCYVWSGKKAVAAGPGNGPGGKRWVSRVGMMKGCVGTVNVAVKPGKLRRSKPRRGKRRGGL